jgi:hypothetical protein
MFKCGGKPWAGSRKPALWLVGVLGYVHEVSFVGGGGGNT